MTAVAGGDRARGAQRCRVNVEPTTPVHPEPPQPSPDSGHRDLDTCVGEFDPDQPCRPRSLPPQLHDLGDDLVADLPWAVARTASAVLQARLPMTAVTVDPFGCRRCADPHLGGDVGDQTVLTALDQTSRPSTDRGALT